MYSSTGLVGDPWFSVSFSPLNVAQIRIKAKTWGKHAIKVKLYKDGTKVDYCDGHPGSGYRNLECSRIAEADEVKLATSLFDCNGADKSLDVYEISGAFIQVRFKTFSIPYRKTTN